MSTLAVKGALVEDIVPAFERRSGIRVHCAFDPTNVLQQRIASGERADVLIATRAYVADLAAARIVDPSTIQALVRTGVGVAVAAQASLRPVASVDELRRLLLDAKSVAYSRTGASGVYFAKLIEKLGIADGINERATVIEKGFTGECVVRGEADVAIQQMSELAMVPGIEIAGPLPDEVQFYTDFDAAVFDGRARFDNSIALRDALFSEQARHAYERLGLTVL